MRYLDCIFPKVFFQLHLPRLYWMWAGSSISCVHVFSQVWMFVTPGFVATRLLCPWDSPAKNTGGGCHFLLQQYIWIYFNPFHLHNNTWEQGHQSTEKLSHLLKATELSRAEPELDGNVGSEPAGDALFLSHPNSAVLWTVSTFKSWGEGTDIEGNTLPPDSS